MVFPVVFHPAACFLLGCLSVLQKNDGTMNIKMFEEACLDLLHSQDSSLKSRVFSARTDNLFFEEFGMSGNDVENLLREGSERTM